MSKRIIELLLIPLLLAACIPSAPAATELPTTAELPTQETVATLPAPTAVPTSGSNGVSMVLPEALGTGLRAEIAPPIQALPDDPYWFAQSVMLDLTLEGYPSPEGAYHQPQIRVYPVEQYSQANEEAKKQITALKDLLVQKTSQPDQIPLIPIFNAAQVFHAGVKYMDFQNGSGVRFLTQYDQGISPLNNQEVFYTFQGITSDGAYYVSVILPTASTDLPANGQMSAGEMDSLAKDFMSYLSTTVEKLDAAPSSSFTPNLDVLDALVSSMTVAPDLVHLTSAEIPPLGNWRPYGNYPGPVSALTQAEIDAQMNQPVELRADQITFNGQTCPVSGYKIESRDAASYFETQYKTSLDTIGIGYTSIEVIQTDCTLPGFAEFVRTPGDILIVNRDGVFFLYSNQ